MEQNLKSNAETKATRARLVMQALGLLPGSNGGMQEVDLSSIPKQVIVDVLRDLENALPDPDVALPKQQATPKRAKPPLEKVARPPQDHGGEHPRIAAVLLKAKPHRMVADSSQIGQRNSHKGSRWKLAGCLPARAQKSAQYLIARRNSLFGVTAR